MKSLFGSIGLLLFALLAQATQAAELVEIQGPPSADPVELTAEDLVVITPKAIAGSSITVEVEGEAEAKVYSLKKIGGDRPLLGPTSQRVVLTPSEKGKVVLKVTIEHPTLEKPKTDVYTFEVK